MANEQRVNEAIKRCRVTRIVVAHRPDTIRSEERILVLQDGAIEAVSSPRHASLKVAALGSGLSLVSDGEVATAVSAGAGVPQS